MENKALIYGRSCLGPTTHLIHQSGLELIPIYENFCYAIALIRQRSVEGVTEGKELLERLYAFQAPKGLAWSGNFPLYLHEYPRCFCPLQSLKIATLLHQLLLEFSHVLSVPFKRKTRRVLKLLLDCACKRREEKPFTPIWEARYRVLIGETPLSNECASSSEWAEELITAQLQGREIETFERLIHPTMRVYCGPSERELQEKNEPIVSVLDAWAQRLSTPHESHLKAVSLIQPYSPRFWSGAVGNWQVRQMERGALCFAEQSVMKKDDRLAMRFIWMGSSLHSLVVATQDARVEIKETHEGLLARFDLPELEEVLDNDFFEVALYCDHSPETEIRIDGGRATLFQLGQMVSIQTPERNIHLRFEIEDGSGNFVGQLSRSNRPFQAVSSGEAYDWKISLRTLKRSAHVCLKLQICFDAEPHCQQPCPSHEVHCPRTAPTL